ncbi:MULTISPECIES: DUF6343 family protein [Protofrankia]|uniref:Uncharacterized protein n=1 Tax=Candidatus Protofrankia datiscae TaxID=2716812 RepID=F8B5Q9_9ACTN|nr:MULTISPECIES: DUF6343 family protein [Protofrankia]AEH10147.1 hypothetical protein FsymDg_2811 [Candidatus Protofrankia datiscae]
MNGGPGGYPPARSALGLRFALALFGLLFATAMCAYFAVRDQPALAVLLGLVALTAVVDLFVIVRRVRREHRW